MNIVQSSCVVLANSHNPSILNSDWLKDQNIIDQNWSLTQQPITTPPFTQLIYSEGITITLDQAKLQVTAVAVDENVWKIAEKVIKVLSHVPYHAVGLNFKGIVDEADPLKYLNTKLIREGPWGKKLSELALTFQYKDGNRKMNYSVSSGTNTKMVEGQNISQSVLSFDANYHKDCSSVTEISQALNRFDNFQAEFEGWVDQFLGRKHK